MKTEIKTNGKTHIVKITAENNFENTVISAIDCYKSKSQLQREDTPKDAANPIYQTLVITMEE